MDKRNIDLAYEQEKFAIFKSTFEAQDEYYENDDHKKTMKRLGKVLDKLPDKEETLKQFSSTILLAELLRDINASFLKVRNDDYGVTEEYYPRVLNGMKQLSCELNLKKSLEISNLYTYLLWNGYLSKTKQNVYRIEKRKLIEGLLFADIMDGVGVCLNHADMLKDFLNTCGYNSSIMVNLVDKNTKNNYRLDIERKLVNPKKGTEFFAWFITPVITKIGNHAFTLIEDNNKLYIYDSTNLMLLKVTNPYTAEIINGSGTYQLHPYFSCVLGSNQGQAGAISKLFMTTDFDSPYNRRDFIFTSEENMDTFKANNRLIEDFYDDIRLDLLSISEATDKIKSRKKNKRLCI